MRRVFVHFLEEIEDTKKTLLKLPDLYQMILLARRDPRRRELQNRAKKERKDLMKCGEDSKSAECVSK